MWHGLSRDATSPLSKYVLQFSFMLAKRNQLAELGALAVPSDACNAESLVESTSIKLDPLIRFLPGSAANLGSLARFGISVR